MLDHMHGLRIADLRIAVSPPPGIAFRPIERPAYRAFQADAGWPHPDIRVSCVLEPPDDWGAAVWRASDNAPLTFACRDGCVRMRWSDALTPHAPWLWHAEVDETDVRAVVHLGARLLHDDRTAAFPFAYPLDQMLMVCCMARHGGLLVHAAAVMTDEGVVVMPGVSGAGKSTLARRFLNAPGCEVLTDDRVILRTVDGIWMAYGTPWPGEAGLARNTGAPLYRLALPRQADRDAFEPMPPAEAMAALWPTVSLPWYDPARLNGALEALDHLVRAVPACSMAFKREGPPPDMHD